MSEANEETITITLTRDEFDLFMLLMGEATGSAMRQGNGARVCSYLGLANSVNKDNPRWIPYQIPDEKNQAPIARGSGAKH